MAVKTPNYGSMAKKPAGQGILGVTPPPSKPGTGPDLTQQNQKTQPLKVEQHEAYNPKVYESTGSYGSGFVNLSHMLGLNRGSGAKSAEDLSKRVLGEGKGATDAISKSYGDFTSAADKGGVKTSDYMKDADKGVYGNTYNAAYMQQGADRAKQGYQGPGSMAESSAYADLAKKTGAAEDLAKNVQTGWGTASQVAKDTGLSAAQSAASSFYMGVNNKGLQRSGDAFQNLRNSLGEANARSVDYASMARKGTEQAAGDLQSQADKARGYWDQVSKNEADEKARRTALPGSNIPGEGETSNDARQDQINAEREQAERQAALDASDKEDQHDQTQIMSTSDMEWAIGKGMPSELAYGGIDYDSWVAAGKPTYEQWIAKFGDPHKGAGAK